MMMIVDVVAELPCAGSATRLVKVIHAEVVTVTAAGSGYRIGACNRDTITGAYSVLKRAHSVRALMVVFKLFQTHTLVTITPGKLRVCAGNYFYDHLMVFLRFRGLSRLRF